MFCEYVRFLILTSDPAYPGFVLTPLALDDQYWSLHVALEAMRLAVEADSRCKPYLADMILSAFDRQMSDALAADRGCIGEPRVMFNARMGVLQEYTGFDFSMVNVCWAALSLDPEAGLRWHSAYDKLTGRAVVQGKIATAMMLGNLAGDLAQGGNGIEDFRRANQAFLRVLDRRSDDNATAWIQATARAYKDCFRDELLEIQRSGRMLDPDFSRLTERLAGFGVSIPKADAGSRTEREFPTGAGQRQP